MSAFKFEVLYQSKRSNARVGRITTPHGIIETPNFVGVGTNGSMKAVSNHQLDELGLQLMFCNTYHLMLQPGTSVVKKAGGLHKFIQRNAPIITDSGGFQVFSLAYGGVASELKGNGAKKGQSNTVLKIDEDGVLFRSYRNGDPVLLTPETSIQAQKDLGADIIIPFDELPPYHIDRKVLVKSLERTHRWEMRSLDAHLSNPQQQAMYAVIHGGVDDALRKQSCDFLSAQPFNGFAIGGSLGKTKDELYQAVKVSLANLPKEAPNHLLGIGDLESIENCVPLGIDTFDSSYPTKAARHGVLFTEQGPLKITRGTFANDFNPIEINCHGPCCKTYSRAYLHHLFKASEPTAHTLASLHNIAYMVRLMRQYRQSIIEDKV